MAVFTVFVKHKLNKLPSGFKWCLDTPRHNDQYEGETLEQNGINIKGWYIKPNSTDATLVVLNGSEVIPLPRNMSRKDVIEKVASNFVKGEKSVDFGFDHSFFPKSNRFAIGFICDASYFPIYGCSIEGGIKVVEGEGKWLFLDNDTNKSVEQFTGKLKLKKLEKKSWFRYIDFFSTLVSSKNKQAVFLIAPSKEFVLSEKYPFKKTRITPLDELKRMAKGCNCFVIPVEALRSYNERTYRMGDTHWSCHGAMVATTLVLEKFGLDTSLAKQTFSQDTYVEQLVKGDLSDKIYPPRKYYEDVLVDYNYRKNVVYDNNLPNFGRAIIIENHQSIYDKNLMIFGSSSAYSMFNYLSRVFRTVVFFHTAGNLDEEIVDKLSPDCLLAQSNARFIIIAPVFGIKMSEYIANKYERLDKRPKLLIKEREMSEFSVKVVNAFAIEDNSLIN